MSPSNVLSKRARPTQTSYRAAVATVIRCVKLQHGLSDVDLAQRIGCSKGTIINADRQKGDLNPVTLLALEHEFGSGTIDLVVELAGSHMTPVDLDDCEDPLPALAMAVQLIATARSKNSPGGVEETHGELLGMEGALVQARRGVNRMLARIKQLRGS